MQLKENKEVVWNVGNITYAAASLLRTVDGEWAEAMQVRMFRMWEEISAESERLGDEYMAELEDFYKKIGV
jgi:hypothetical protein